MVATTDDDYAAFGDLIREYWGWLQSRYSDLPGFIDAVGGHQALDAELSSLRDTFGPSKGLVILARRGDVVVGAIAFRDLGDGACEMKRPFVPNRFQGEGTRRRRCSGPSEVLWSGVVVARRPRGRCGGEASRSSGCHRVVGFSFIDLLRSVNEIGSTCAA